MSNLPPGIYKLVSKTGKISFKVHIHRRGIIGKKDHYTKTFANRKDAIRYKQKEDAAITERGAGLGPEPEHKELRKATFEIIGWKYLEQLGFEIHDENIKSIVSILNGTREIEPSEEFKNKETEIVNLRAFLTNKANAYIYEKSLYDITKAFWDEYVKRRSKELNKSGEPIARSSIRREVSTFQRVFALAKDWGHPNLKNPLERYKIAGSTKGRRSRSASDMEIEKLIEACDGCLDRQNEPLQWRIYAPLAIYMAVETGMRLQEIFNLEWGDIDIERRWIYIRKSKTDHLTDSEGRVIVLPIRTEWRLRPILATAIEKGRAKKTDTVFPLTKNGRNPKDAFEQVWKDILIRSGIVEEFLEKHHRATPKYAKLHFHDLRRTANQSFYSAGLDAEQREIMLGHADGEAKSTNRGYLNDPEIMLPPIQEKLDKHFLAGRTMEDAQSRVVKTEHISEIRNLLGELKEAYPFHPDNPD
jgi:integrase